MQYGMAGDGDDNTCMLLHILVVDDVVVVAVVVVVGASDILSLGAKKDVTLKSQLSNRPLISKNCQVSVGPSAQQCVAN